jgi:uncharacterized membrane protein YgdD (TMEM256/DUF423 family)
MHKGYLSWATALAGLAVILGAFGAHALKQSIPADALVVYETGIRYQFYHSLALLAVALLYKKIPGQWLYWSAVFFICGIFLFSGSLYAITAVKAANGPNITPLGVVTPVGGLSLIAGWFCLFMGGRQIY